MKNIEYLLTKTEIPIYTREEYINILKAECDIHGKKEQLVRCMEEYSELIEVIIMNNIRGRIDYIDLAEEIADCQFCIEVIKILYDLKDSDISKNFKNIYQGENILNNCILNLAQSSINLSKCVREKDKAGIKIIGLINLINETIFNIIYYYKMDIKIIEKIFMLKIKRSDERNQKYWETMGTNTDQNKTDKLDSATIDIASSDENEYNETISTLDM